MSRTLTAALLLLSAGVPVAAEPKVERITVSYDVAHLLHQGGGKTGYDSIDDVIKAVVTTVHPEAWLLAPDGGNRIFEANGKRLEILAPKAEHDQIKELLETLRRINDLAVDVKVTFLALDPKRFEMDVQPYLGKQFPAAPESEAAEIDYPELARAINKLREGSEIVQSTKSRLANGREADLASLRRAFAFAKPALGENGKAAWGVEFTGVSYRCKATVGKDRRFVNLKIDDVWREAERDKKDEKAPRMIEKKTTTEVRLKDGYATLLRVPYTPESIKDRKRILILLVETQIFIQAEEKERRGDKDKG
jgi:hypothetical protein